MSHPIVTPEERYQKLVEAFRANPDVSLGSGKRGFGSSALCVHGQIFAMLSQGRLVVKLPRARVDALVAAGGGEPFDPRRDGRRMREWLSVEPASDAEWLPLAREALVFVSSVGPLLSFDPGHHDAAHEVALGEEEQNQAG